MRYIGDIHGNAELYSAALQGCDESIQVGDYGLGFVPIDDTWPAKPHSNHCFIRGNHDNPNLAYSNPLHLNSGKSKRFPGHFIIEGGRSVDRALRIEGKTWWRDEEHSNLLLGHLVELYAEAKPRVMVSHEGPVSITDRMFKGTRRYFPGIEPSRTAQALEACLSFHQPETWIFGHWHQTECVVQNGTAFICLAEGAQLDI